MHLAGCWPDWIPQNALGESLMAIFHFEVPRTLRSATTRCLPPISRKSGSRLFYLLGAIFPQWSWWTNSTPKQMRRSHNQYLTTMYKHELHMYLLYHVLCNLPNPQRVHKHWVCANSFFNQSWTTIRRHWSHIQNPIDVGFQTVTIPLQTGVVCQPPPYKTYQNQTYQNIRSMTIQPTEFRATSGSCNWPLWTSMLPTQFAAHPSRVSCVPIPCTSSIESQKDPIPFTTFWRNTWVTWVRILNKLS